MRSCIFCGGPASSKEDAWPLWVLRCLDADGPGQMNAERGDNPTRTWRLVRAGLKVRFVCTVCNNGWMSELENRAKPVVEMLLSDSPVTVDSDAQKVLSVWATKNAMVFEALRLKPVWAFTAQERGRLRESSELPARTTVWIAKCVDPPGPYCSASDLSGIVDASQAQMRAYVTTMVFGPLAIQVLRLTVPPGVPLSTTVTADVRPGPWESVALRVSPSRPVVIQWPPFVGLSGAAGVDAFSERWSPSAA